MNDLVAGLQSAQDVFEIQERDEISVGLLNETRQRTDLIWSSDIVGREQVKQGYGRTDCECSGQQFAAPLYQTVRRRIGRPKSSVGIAREMPGVDGKAGRRTVCANG